MGNNDYLWLTLSSIRVQEEAAASKLLLFETFPFFFLFITDVSYRGAPAPKNVIRSYVNTGVRKNISAPYPSNVAE